MVKPDPKRANSPRTSGPESGRLTAVLLNEPGRAETEALH
jgi:hypothetical protein